MHEGDGDRSLANGGGHAFEIARAYVADGEYPGQARFQEERGTRQGPRRLTQVLL
jgi:hypothetical protein